MNHHHHHPKPGRTNHGGRAGRRVGVVGELEAAAAPAPHGKIWCGREDSNLHPQRGPGPKPGASTSSATPAERPKGAGRVYGAPPV